MSLETKIRLGLQGILNGWVGPETRVVSAEWTRSTVTVFVFSDGEVPDEYVEELEEEVEKCLTPLLDPEYSGKMTYNTRFVNCPEPDDVPARGVVVFARRGTGFAT